MDPDVQEFAQVMFVLVSSFGAVVLISGLAKWMFFRRTPKVVRSDKEDERLRRIEEAVDAIAVEVERISEGQRFTTKLLAERVPELEPQAREVVPVRQGRA
ncbi:MAG TPA: hypothetical protein VF761_10995 [Gemmatimonadaceae bacterium]